ncbi:MAG: hypothetical protein A2096_02190 [Spirochaetes bacterium GWF1_41_5]|nr:MAG: hypothetical protein A2096_02190 [Spirochaetes bacterium GWF1_41_5]HBE02237.1 hypothetical protein [Spirochaetia bacterium]
MNTAVCSNKRRDVLKKLLFTALAAAFLFFLYACHRKTNSRKTPVFMNPESLPVQLNAKRKILHG